MKKIIVLVLSTMVVMTGCSLLKGSASSASSSASTAAATTAPVANSSALTAGNGAGQALLGLYSQYKADGKYDYKNISNISNTVLLLANITELPSNVKNSTYLKEFGQGMMSSAASLITPDNVETVTDNLTTLAGQYTEKAKTSVSQTADKAATTVSSAADKLNTAAQTAGSIASLLSMFK